MNLKKIIKILIFAAALTVAISSAISFVSAEESSGGVEVYVTVSCDSTLLVPCKSISVTDRDGDGKVTVNDALIQIHEQDHTNGKDGYSADVSNGYTITSLWGIKNGILGFRVNELVSTDLNDELNVGDHIHAYAISYVNTEDDAEQTVCYGYFDETHVNVDKYKSATLKLSGSLLNSNREYDVSTLPYVIVTVNGELTNYRTDENGMVTIPFDETGEYVISVKSSDPRLVYPVCIVNVENPTDYTVLVTCIGLSIVAVSGLAVYFIRRIVNGKENKKEAPKTFGEDQKQ